MSKVGILSFPRYYNYGTFLQLFALQQVVADAGYQPEVIDYDPYNDSGGGLSVLHRMIERIKGPLRWLRPRGCGASEASFTVAQRKQRRRFAQFLQEQLPLGTKTYFSHQQLLADPPLGDAFIVGSDQVWNPFSHDGDPAYYLHFAKREQRIAYAPSFGVSALPAKSHSWVAENLSAIPHLSVREQAGADIVESLTGRQVPVVLDPAYLLDDAQWSRFAANEALPERPYLLAYFLESDPYMRQAALALAEAKGLLPVMIPVNACDDQDEGKRFTHVTDAGPQQFVGLLKHAAYVCTDSFHGTSFAILFNRPFSTFKRYANPVQAANHSRLDSILRLTGLQQRIADPAWTIAQLDSAVEFTYANAQIAHLREGSVGYLRQALQMALEANETAELVG